MKISINEPCHEDWDKMTPNDKGAFCLACQKTVVDFSSKTIDEIKNFFVLKPKTESVCGRFRDKQLHELSFDDFMNEFMSWKFLKRAAVLCFLVLATTLFSSCSTGPGGGETHTAGVVAYDSTLNVKPLLDTVSKESTLLLQDSVKTKKLKKKKNKKPVQEIIHMKGDVAVN